MSLVKTRLSVLSSTSKISRLGAGWRDDPDRRGKGQPERRGGKISEEERRVQTNSDMCHKPGRPRLVGKLPAASVSAPELLCLGASCLK